MGLSLAAQEGLSLAAAHRGRGARRASTRPRCARNCCETFNIEIGAGLGPFKGKVWRIGLMGESSRRENVMLVLSALETILESMGFEIARGKSLAAADRAYDGSAA